MKNNNMKELNDDEDTLRQKDIFYMKKAIELAKLGEGKVNPNPMVGAILVKNNQIIGQGFHEKYGELHAERNAFKNCEEDTTGATLYVTLEPCCHHGKTPPCTDAILEHKISRVVIGSLDPNTLVGGKGVDILKQHGIKVETGVLIEECMELNQVFFHFITKHTPFVVMKYAMTADGKIATKTGESKWITNETSRHHVHISRNKYASIMVGIGTVLADDPVLTCRIDHGNNPIRIILDSHLELPLSSNITKTARMVSTIVATVESNEECCTVKQLALEKMGIKVLPIKSENGQIDLKELMIQLGKLQIDSVFLEGGATLQYSALMSGIVNELQAYIAPKIIGGCCSLSPVGGEGIADLKDSIRLKYKNTTIFDGDIRLDYDVEV